MGCSNMSPVPDDSGVQLRGVDVNNVEGSTDRQLPQQGQGVAVDHGKHTCVWGGQITLVKATIRTGLSNDTFYCEGAWNIQIHLHRPTCKVLPNTHTRIHACVHTHTHRHSRAHTQCYPCDLTHWLSFRSMWGSLIHERPRIRLCRREVSVLATGVIAPDLILRKPEHLCPQFFYPAICVC